MDRVDVAPGAGVTDGKHAARCRRIETLVAGAGGLPLHQILGRGNPSFELAGRIEGYDA